MRLIVERSGEEAEDCEFGASGLIYFAGAAWRIGQVRHYKNRSPYEFPPDLFHVTPSIFQKGETCPYCAYGLLTYDDEFGPEDAERVRDAIFWDGDQNEEPGWNLICDRCFEVFDYFEDDETLYYMGESAWNSMPTTWVS